MSIEFSIELKIFFNDLPIVEILSRVANMPV